MKFASGLTPISDLERETWASPRRERIERGVKRRKAAPRGRYDLPRTDQVKRVEARKLGERLAD